ncbi:MAG: Fe-S cluster assembly protein SufD, partial [Deltaproteobacteria bacterium]|nr:Fe-S cluster assembly protein SufD [Deltaproteobacteria bacterium]
LVIERGAEVVAPIHFLYCSTGTADHASYPRLLLLCGESCSCNVVETFVALSDARYLSAPVTEVVVGANARVTHTKVQAESTSAFHIGSLWVDQARSSNFTSNVFHFGGALVRSEINPVMNGEGSECYLNGLTAVGASQHIDNHTVIDHAKPNAFSREIYKGIYDGSARGVFSGTIIVREDAQKTNAIQQNHSILVSENASVDSKPQLKIWADDVKCTHGATVGQLDEHALFYLRSRGIGKETARNMLLHAFASEVIQHVPQESLRESLEGRLLSNLGQHLA